jgi:TolB protein
MPALAMASMPRSDGAELVYATAGSMSAQNPAFSPDGSTLMFTLYSRGYDGKGGPGGVWKMPAAGGTASAIYNGYGATNVNGWIYFESHRAAHDDDSPTQIWRVANPLRQQGDFEPLCLAP